VKAKLLKKAGKIRRGAKVELVSKDEKASAQSAGPAEAPDDPSPVYTVRDEESHEEHVDTRDLKPLL